MSKQGDMTETRWWAWLGVGLLLGNLTGAVWFLLVKADLLVFVLAVSVAISLLPHVWENRKRLL